MLFDTKFDLVISIGESCACSGYLRRFKLQDYSYPLDWLTGASFESRIDVLTNNFNDFLNIDNLSKLEKNQNMINDNKCDYYQDSVYNFIFLHDFKINQPFEQEYENVKTKYNRRIKRMYEQIEKSDKILFVWFGWSNFPDAQVVKSCYQRLSEKFKNKSVYLLVIEHSEDIEEMSYFENKHILITKYKSLLTGNNETMGCEKNNAKIFSQIKMNRNFKWYLKLYLYFFIKIFVEIIPFKEFRIKQRQKLKAKFYKDVL